MTGVQTCALPISRLRSPRLRSPRRPGASSAPAAGGIGVRERMRPAAAVVVAQIDHVEIEGLDQRPRGAVVGAARVLQGAPG